MSIKLNNVRLSFPSLWSTEKFNGEDTEKYTATFILDKIEHADKIKEIQAKIAEGTKSEFKGKSIPADKICLKDGDETGRVEYANSYIIKGSTKKRPTVIDRDKTPLLEEDGKPYSGCYVNGIINLWYQNNSWGKRVNCNLMGVQFYKDGESFGSGPVDVTDDFDSFDDDEMF